MIAPKAPGHTVRSEFEKGGGIPDLIAVQQDVSGTAKEIALSYASAIGGGRTGILETSFREETETDLFGEQTVLCGGLVELMKNGYETLVEAGYQPEIAYFEVLHELKLIVDMIQKYGINGMWRRVSETARYGGLTRGPMVMNNQTKEQMKKVLQEIQDGTFNKEWLSEYEKSGKNAFDKYMKQLDSHQIERVGKQMRKMMWPDSTE